MPNNLWHGIFFLGNRMSLFCNPGAIQTCEVCCTAINYSGVLAKMKTAIWVVSMRHCMGIRCACPACESSSNLAGLLFCFSRLHTSIIKCKYLRFYLCANCQAHGTLNPHSHFMLQEQQPQVSAPHKRERPGHHSQHPEQRRLRSSGSQHEQGAGHPIKRWTHEPAGSGLPATAFASRRRKRGGGCSGRSYCRPAGEGHVQHQPAEHRAHRGARGQQQSHGDHLPVHDTGDCGPGWAVRRLQDLLSERWVLEMLETKFIKIFNFMKFLISL